MNWLLTLTVVTVIVVVLFDYTNGFHDASNIVATIVASRAATPIQAVILVAVFEFLGPLLAGTAVADTIGNFVNVRDLPAAPSVAIVLCGVLGAICWNLLTWWLAIPSSSSHALVGGLVGVVVIAAGPDHVVWGVGELAGGKLVGVTKVILALLLSPLVGFVVGFVIHRLMRLLLRAARPTVNRSLRRVQFVTAAGLAFSHGANDAQKSMGVITMLLVLGGYLPRFEVPLWVIVLCATAVTAGILSGGWRIVRTVGFGIYKLRPLHAVDAQLTAGSVILGAALFGAPVSTTHVVTSSIMGIGASERPRAVRWQKGKEIVAAWVVTIPAAATVAILIYTVASWLISSVN
ncbi:Low-affinity inorganic phosphate transporter 1 [Bremerella volcania]|uniref:Low-affinity inorganic phosphate transporter 1 n=1 Tax=Bremerella volcania TaxID=2527984 RepID=A0A518C5X1_9BACT|nr:inorganic phosphate transporter [Bremerella volcania]QDU74604.1 Low-affinity inorganic phosphate transporter 1 [Bremerella volcania]